MKRRVCAILLAASLAVCGLTGCGNGSQSSAGQEKVRLMVWSPSEDQSKESGEWLQTMCESFAEENPQWDITFVYGVADEATAASQVSQDPEASADVFMYANDTLTTMTDANALLVTWLYKLTVDKQYYNIGAVIGILTFIILAVGALFTYRRSKSYKEEGGF